MVRLTVVLMAWMSFVSGASANLAPPKAARTARQEIRPGKAAKSRERPVVQTAPRADGAEFAVTERTQIMLNGNPCTYADVPEHARIVQMEVGPDKKTVLRIYFRTGK
jgi:hypothetical protein